MRGRNEERFGGGRFRRGIAGMIVLQRCRELAFESGFFQQLLSVITVIERALQVLQNDLLSVGRVVVKQVYHRHAEERARFVGFQGGSELGIFECELAI